MTTWIDITVPLRSGMVHWPGDPDPRIERTLAIERGDGMNLSAASLSLHTGTHVDAPLHFLRGGAGIERMPVEAMIGPARVLAIRHPRTVTAEELARYRPRRGERLLLKTRNSGRCWGTPQFVEDFVSLSPEAAHYLASRGVRTLGIDYLSVGSFRGGEETHRVLLAAGTWIVEGLDLRRAAPGRYQLLCLPLKVPGADGAPARALLRRLIARA